MYLIVKMYVRGDTNWLILADASISLNIDYYKMYSFSTIHSEPKSINSI